MCRAVSDIKYLHSLHIVRCFHALRVKPAGLTRFFLLNSLILSCGFLRLSVIPLCHHFNVQATSFEMKKLSFIQFQVAEFFIRLQKLFSLFFLYTCAFSRMHSYFLKNFLNSVGRGIQSKNINVKSTPQHVLKMAFNPFFFCKRKCPHYSYLRFRLNYFLLRILFFEPSVEFEIIQGVCTVSVCFVIVRIAN